MELFYSMFTYFPKFSPSCIVSGNSQFIVSGKSKQSTAPNNGPMPNISGGNQICIVPYKLYYISLIFTK